MEKPELENKETEREIREETDEIAHMVIDGLLKNRSSHKELTLGVIMAEFVALDIASTIGFNAVVQDKATVEEYAEWFKKELIKTLNERLEDKDDYRVAYGELPQ